MRKRFKNIFFNFKLLTEENKLINEKLIKSDEMIKNWKREMEVLQDLVNLQKDKILNLQKSELELSYFKTNNNMSIINSIILNNQIVEKNKYLIEINEILQTKNKDYLNKIDVLNIEKYDILTKYKILKNARQKSIYRVNTIKNNNEDNSPHLLLQIEQLEEGYEILLNAKEVLLKKNTDLKKDNDVLNLTKIVYLEKIDELCEKMKIVDENNFLNLTKHQNQIICLQNQNEEYKKKILILTEGNNNVKELKKSINSKSTNSTIVEKDTFDLDEKLKENNILRRELKFSGNEIKKYENYILELKQRNMNFRNKFNELNKRFEKEKKKKRKRK